MGRFRIRGSLGGLLFCAVAAVPLGASAQETLQVSVSTQPYYTGNPDNAGFLCFSNPDVPDFSII